MTTRLAVLLLLLLGAAAPTRLAAQPIERLGLGQALERAEANTLLRAEFEEAMRFHDQQERERWRKLYLPALTFQVTERDGNLTGQESDQTNEARVEYLLYGGGRDEATYRSARNASAISAHEREQALAELKVSVADAYLNLSAAHQRVGSIALAVERAELELSNAEKRQRLGLRTQLEVLQARVALADTRLQLREEQRSREVLALRLSHLIRGEVSPATDLETALPGFGPPLPLSEYQSWAGEHHPLLLKAREEYAQAGNQEAARKGVDRPEVYLNSGYSDSGDNNTNTSVVLALTYRFGGHRAVVSRNQTRATVVERFFQTDTSGEITEQVLAETRNLTTSRYGVTLFDFQDSAATAESSLLEARLARARSGRLLVEAEEARTREVALRYGEFQTAQARQEVAALRVEKNQAEAAAYRRAFQTGTVRFEEFLERQTELNRSVLDEITARAQLHLAWINLRGAAAMPLLP